MSASWQPQRPAGIVTFTNAADVVIAKISWLWHEQYAFGKLHIIAGLPSAGKTTVVLSIAATCSNGGTLPDGTTAHRCKVLVWSGEDDIDDTLAPRLAAMGANMKNIDFITSTDKRPFDPATDMQGLCERIEANNASGGLRYGMLIVDPVVSVIPSKSNDGANVRRGLQPLVDLAAKFKVVAVGVHHFTKGTAGANTLERVTGSLYFGATPRIVHIAAKREAGATGASRMFVRLKSNIGPEGDGFGYDLIQSTSDQGDFTASVVAWRKPLQGTAQDLLNDAENIEDKKPDNAKLMQAKHFITNTLAKGPMLSTEIERLSHAAKVSNHFLKKAKKDLGVTSYRTTNDGPWYHPTPTLFHTTNQHNTPPNEAITPPTIPPNITQMSLNVFRTSFEDNTSSSTPPP